MEKHQTNKFRSYFVTIITAVWTISFLLLQGISAIVGNELMKPRWSVSGVDSWTYLPFGLAIAIFLSGLSTALIMRRAFSQIKWRHIILITSGWGVSAMIMWFVVSILLALV